MSIINETSNYAKVLPDRLLLSRRDLNWNQSDLAAKSGVSRGHISNIERGHTTNVTVEVIFSLAEALGVSPLYLLDMVGDPLFGIADLEKEDERKAQVLKGETLHLGSIDSRVLQSVRRFIDLFVTLPRRDQDVLLRMAEAMAMADTPRVIGEEEERNGDGRP